MGTISQQQQPDQIQTTLNQKLPARLPDEYYQVPARLQQRNDHIRQIYAIGTDLCGSSLEFCAWFRKSRQHAYADTPLHLLNDAQLSQLHAELTAIQSELGDNAALIATITTHITALANANEAEVRLNLVEGANFRSNGRTRLVAKMTHRELVQWQFDLLNPVPPLAKIIPYTSRKRIVAKCGVDGNLALSYDWATEFKTTKLHAIAHSTAQTNAQTKVIPISGIKTTPVVATPQKVVNFPLMLSAGKNPVVALLPARVETLATPAQRVTIQDTIKRISSGVNWRVIITEQCAINWNEYVTEVEALQIMEWAEHRQSQIPTDAGIIKRNLRTHVKGGNLHAACVEVSHAIAADIDHLTFAELNQVLAKFNLPLHTRRVIPVDFATDAERWHYLNANIFPLETGLKVDRMLCRANNGIPQTITRATRTHLEKYHAILLGLKQSQPAPQPTPPALSFGDGTTRRLGGDKKVA